MRGPSGFDLLAAFLGTLGAILLLIAAFAASAEERPHTTDRLVVRLPHRGEADRTQPMGADRARTLRIAARTWCHARALPPRA